MKVRFLVCRSDGVDVGDVVDLDPAEAERVIASGAGEPATPKRTKRRAETETQPPAGETR